MYMHSSIDENQSEKLIKIDESFDLADLVSVLFFNEEPCSNIDVLIEFLLGQRELRDKITIPDVKGLFWLKDQIPPYTKGTSCINAIAHIRGYLLESVQTKDGWITETRDLVSGDKIAIKHKLKGPSAIIGIATLSSRKSK